MSRTPTSIHKDPLELMNCRCPLPDPSNPEQLCNALKRRPRKDAYKWLHQHWMNSHRDYRPSDESDELMAASRLELEIQLKANNAILVALLATLRPGVGPPTISMFDLMDQIRVAIIALPGPP